jgi:sporulation protein YunB
MKKVKLKNKQWIKPKASTILTLILISVCFFSGIILIKFNQIVTPKMIEVASKNLEKLTFNLFNNYTIMTQIDDDIVNNILKVHQNDKGEIINISYNTKNAYHIANLLANRIKNDFNAIENGKLNIEYYDQELSNGLDGFVLSLPIGVASNSAYFTNLGPRIPVKIKFIGTILTNLKTKVQDYGINNALVEVYIDVSISHEIITPVTFQTKELNYEIMISAQIINGTVPSLYGGLYETKSNILNVPIN